MRVCVCERLPVVAERELDLGTSRYHVARDFERIYTCVLPKPKYAAVVVVVYHMASECTGDNTHTRTHIRHILPSPK